MRAWIRGCLILGVGVVIGVIVSMEKEAGKAEKSSVQAMQLNAPVPQKRHHAGRRKYRRVRRRRSGLSPPPRLIPMRLCWNITEREVQTPSVRPWKLSIPGKPLQTCRPGHGGDGCAVSGRRWLHGDWNPIASTGVFEDLPPKPATRLPPNADLIVDIRGDAVLQLSQQLHQRGSGGVVVVADTFLGTSEEWLAGVSAVGGRHPGYQQFKERVRSSGYADFIAPLPAPPETAARIIFATSSVDLVRVPADATTDAVFDYIRSWWPVLRVGGLVQGTAAARNSAVLKALSVAAGTEILIDGDEWYLRKLVDRPSCVSHPAFHPLQQLSSLPLQWKCGKNEDCAAGTCTQGKCLCPAGRGGVRCQIGAHLWLKDASPWVPAPDPTVVEPSTTGWNGGFGNFREVFEEYNITSVIEVGVWRGMSSITMAKLLKQRGQGGLVISVDTFLGSVEHWIVPRWYHELHVRSGYPQFYDIFRNNVVREGLEEYIVPFPVMSSVAARVLHGKGVQVDLIHVDASHEYDDVVADMQDWWPLVRVGGILYGDDYHWAGVAQGVTEFCDKYNLSMKIYGENKDQGLECQTCKWAIQKPLDYQWSQLDPPLIAL